MKIYHGDREQLSHNQNQKNTTETRRHGENQGKGKSKTNPKYKATEQGGEQLAATKLSTKY